jgi:hypothetical protein
MSGVKRKQPHSVEDWPLDARMIAAAAPIQSFELRASIRARIAILSAHGEAMERAIHLLPLTRDRMDATRFLWEARCADMMTVCTPARVKMAELSRARLYERVLEYQASSRVAATWGQAAAEAIVVLRRSLPGGLADHIAAYL